MDWAKAVTAAAFVYANLLHDSSCRIGSTCFCAWRCAYSIVCTVSPLRQLCSGEAAANRMAKVCEIFGHNLLLCGPPYSSSLLLINGAFRLRQPSTLVLRADSLVPLFLSFGHKIMDSLTSAHKKVVRALGIACATLHGSFPWATALTVVGAHSH